MKTDGNTRHGSSQGNGGLFRATSKLPTRKRREEQSAGGLNRNAWRRKKQRAQKACFRRKIGKARAFRRIPLYSSSSSSSPRVITVHHVHASHTPPRLSTIPPRMLLIAACWQSKLSHTRPRHGYESLSTRQFSVFCGEWNRRDISIRVFRIPTDTRFFSS